MARVNYDWSKLLPKGWVSSSGFLEVTGEPTSIRKWEQTFKAVPVHCACGNDVLLRCSKLYEGKILSCGCLSDIGGKSNPRVMPDDGYIDEVAVQRMVDGDKSIRYTRPEITEAVRRLTIAGKAESEIVEILGIDKTRIPKLRRDAGLKMSRRSGTYSVIESKEAV